MTFQRKPAAIAVAIVAAMAVGDLLGLPSAPQARGQVTFRGLGDLPGGETQTIAADISADGSTVVGRSISAAGSEAFRWTQAGGIQSIGDLSGGSVSSYASAVNDDGTVIVGHGTPLIGNEAFRWTLAGGMTSLGNGPSFTADANGVSGDGNVVAGFYPRDAFRWTAATGMTPLPHLPSQGWEMYTEAISRDGSTIVGFDHAIGGTYEAFRWTASGGTQSLGDFEGGSVQSRAHDVDDDGSVIVGVGESDGNPATASAFRWTAATGLVNLGDLPGGDVNAAAHAVSGDGAVVVGWSNTMTGDQAFIWTQATGMQDLTAVLVAGGADLAGWDLYNALAISADGRTIAGNARNPAGQHEAWVATIPEPTGAAAMMALALAAGMRRRRRRGGVGDAADRQSPRSPSTSSTTGLMSS